MNINNIQNEEIIKLIKQVPIFSALSDKEHELVAAASEVCTFNTGDILFSSDDAASHSYVVRRGSVDIYRIEASSILDAPPVESLIATFLPGDSFGEMELLTQTAHHEIARAPEAADILLFPSKKTSLASFLHDHPAVGAKMLFSYLKSTAARQRQALSVIKENSPQMQELKKQVYGDKLTGLNNKTYLEEEMPRFIENHERLALVMFKPDNFKQINDTYGHEAGDQVIVLMASELAKCARKADISIRYMGNELALVLPGCGRKEALSEVSRIRKIMNELDISATTNNEPFSISVSFGISLFPVHTASAKELIALAHELPLIGRGRGGNQILFPEDR